MQCKVKTLDRQSKIKSASDAAHPTADRHQHAISNQQPLPKLGVHLPEVLRGEKSQCNPSIEQQADPQSRISKQTDHRVFPTGGPGLYHTATSPSPQSRYLDHPEPELASFREHINFLRANDMLVQSSIPTPVEQTLAKWRKAKIKVDWNRIGVKTKMIQNRETGEMEEQVVVRRGKLPSFDIEAFFAKQMLDEVYACESMSAKEQYLEMVRAMNANSMPKRCKIVQGEKTVEEIGTSRMVGWYGVATSKEKLSATTFGWDTWERVLEDVPKANAKRRARQRWRLRGLQRLSAWVVWGQQNLFSSNRELTIAHGSDSASSGVQPPQCLDSGLDDKD